MAHSLDNLGKIIIVGIVIVIIFSIFAVRRT